MANSQYRLFNSPHVRLATKTTALEVLFLFDTNPENCVTLPGVSGSRFSMPIISQVNALDARFDLHDGAGSDAIHTDPQYGYGVTRLHTDSDLSGTGIAYTLGGGTNLVCDAIDLLSAPLVGRDIEELMANFGEVQRQIAEEPRIRWLGPHKGVIHLALSSITNACFDLWAKHRGVPLWKLLLDLPSDALANLVDFTYLEEVLPRKEFIEIFDRNRSSRGDRDSVLKSGYPGYDTSVGWIQYSDDVIQENVKRAIDAGFTAMKLKVGLKDSNEDIRRAELVRNTAGTDATIMLDANQIWSLPVAIEVGLRLNEINPYWLEEPTEPDDVIAHQTLARELAPTPIAVGEAVSNRIIWKNFFQANAVGICQADCTRLAGVSEYLAVVAMAKKFNVKVVPHVGDMGQIHQHLVFFNHIALDLPKLFLEHIPHLREHFVVPANVSKGVYQAPEAPGCSTDLKCAMSS
jgi:L-fuconate dehydratase